MDSPHTAKTDNTKRSYDSDELESLGQEETSEVSSNPENDIVKTSEVADLTLNLSKIDANSQQKAPSAIEPQTEKPAQIENGKSERSGVDAAAPLG